MRHTEVSSRKPPSNPDDWDDFDIPTWDDASSNAPTRSNTASTPQRRGSSGSTYPDPLYDDYETPSYPSSQPQSNKPPAKLSSRVPTRSTRPTQDPYRDSYAGTSVDPYDPVDAGYDAPRQQAAASSQYDLYAEPAYDSSWDDATAYQTAPATRRKGRRGTRSARSSVSIAKPAISDEGMVALVSAAALGLLAMIGVVWYGAGDLSDLIPWHLNASGEVDKWVTNPALWRIPFGVFMSLLLGLVLGAYLWKRDRFAARFIVASMCIVQVLAWVAVVDQLW